MLHSVYAGFCRRVLKSYQLSSSASSTIIFAIIGNTISAYSTANQRLDNFLAATTACIRASPENISGKTKYNIQLCGMSISKFASILKIASV